MSRFSNPQNPIPYERVGESGAFLWRRSLSNSGWFFIAVLISINSDPFKEISRQYPQIFRREHMWSTNGYRSYLSSEEYNELSSNSYFQISKHRDIHSNNFTYSSIESYSIIASESFYHEKCRSTRFERFYCEELSNDEIDKILRDARVFSAFPVENINFNSRFSVGYLQSGVNKNVYEDDDGLMYRTPRTLLTHGLDGTGEIVSVIDTGVNYNHTFFYDPEVEVPINETDLSHRKIVRYDPMYEDKDYDGHGTRVCGLICGTPTDKNAANKLYEGVAPGAKLHIVDVTDRSTSFQVDVDPYSQIEIMNDLDAHISSNSWSSNSANEMSDYYNAFAYENKDILYIFPSGNGGYSNYFGSPVDARNVLTVGFTTRPSAAQIESSRTIIITNGTASFDIISESSACSVYQTESPLKSFKDLEISTTDEAGKAFLTNSCPGDQIQASLVIAATIDECTDPQNVQTLYVNDSLYENISEMITVSVDFVTTDETLTKSRLSNTGPTQYQFKKPELVAPGENIMSAAVSTNYTGDTSFDTLSADSGSSFAVPQVAGLAALARQYFAKGFYPTLQENEDNIILPSSSLLKAVLINSARKVDSTSIINWNTGFGIPVLQDSLGFGEYGVRFVDRQPVHSHSVCGYRITTTRESDLSITLSYIDYYSTPLLYCDLDLVVMNEETGEVWTGNNLQNHRPEEFQTNERVYIENASIGTYTIYVYSGIFYEGTDEDPINIDFALAIMGGFDTNDDKTNPYQLELLDISELKAPGNCSDRGTFNEGICECPLPYAGHMCEYEMRMLDIYDGRFAFTKPPLDYVNYQYRTFPPGSQVKVLFGGIPNIIPYPQTLHSVSFGEPRLSNGNYLFTVYLDGNLYISDFITPPEGATTLYFSLSAFNCAYTSDTCVFIQVFPPRSPEYLIPPSPLETPEITPYRSPMESPVVTPYQTPAMTTPIMTPLTTPYDSPYQSPFQTPAITTPIMTPLTTPYDSPYQSPFQTPSISTPFMTPSISTPFRTFHMSTPFETPLMSTPLGTPLMSTPAETVAASPFETPFSSPCITPVNTPKNTLAPTIYIPTINSADDINNGGVNHNNDNNNSSLNIGAIIGGTIGGLIAIAIIIILILFIKNRQDRSEAPSADDEVMINEAFENIDGNEKLRSYLETIPIESEIGMSEDEDSSFSSSSNNYITEDIEFGF